MNKTKIEWCDYTWNPITGCNNNCPYCYARKISMRFNGNFDVEFHPERLTQPLQLKKPSKIFVCSMGDMYDDKVCEEWRIQIFSIIDACPQHEFFILTKRPENVLKYPTPKILQPNHKVWMGVSVDGRGAIYRIKELRKIPVFKRFVSFEPLLGNIGKVSLKGIDKIIIGGQTNPTKIPKPEWITNIKKQAIFDAGCIDIFTKRNATDTPAIQSQQDYELKGGG